ncbi:hypothetical protein H0H81_008974 [Sphagnurus paluster]|uniref:Protein kinase domain-containing protein n=1 Tax=Sphagnurus paluster TaxID=117069 RepID=A0A9P7GQV5_9AGAR|nr:hypothetical protein H0H81_008974 [Sphagnurus paluster]
MRAHGRNNKRKGKGQDEEPYLGGLTNDMRPEPYSRLHESSRHTDSYRINSSSNRPSYDTGRGPTTSRQRHVDSWRRGPGDVEEERHSYITNDVYHRQNGGREDHDILEPEIWSGRGVPYASSRNEWAQRYDYSYPPSSYAESSSRNPPIIPHDTRPAPDHWPPKDPRIDDHHSMTLPDDRLLERSPTWAHGHNHRRDKGDPKFHSDSGWDAHRRSKTWEEPPVTSWDDAPRTKGRHTANERSWDPAPSWQPPSDSRNEQDHRYEQQRNSYRHPNSNLPSNFNSKNNGKRNTYTNKPKRDWRNDDGALNNWQKREVHQLPERATKPQPPPKRKYPRSPSPRSRSRSPVGSYYSRRSSWDRSRSRSVSPLPKRQRRGATPPAVPSRSPSDRGRAWAPNSQYDKHDFSPSSPKSPRRTPLDYRSSEEPGRAALAAQSVHDRERSPYSPKKSPDYATSDRGRAILRPNSRYAKETTLSMKRSPASYVRRRRSLSSTSSLSSERSQSQSPPERVKPVHRLPLVNTSLSPDVPLRALGSTLRKSSHQKNGKSQANGKNNNGERRKSVPSGQSLRIDSMPPPSTIPLPHLPHPVYTLRETHAPPPYSQPTQPVLPPHPQPTPPESQANVQAARFTPVKNAGFKPINQTSSSLKKFFPVDEEDVDTPMDDSRAPMCSIRERDTFESVPPPNQVPRGALVHHERKIWPSPPSHLSPSRQSFESSVGHQDPASSRVEAHQPREILQPQPHRPAIIQKVETPVRDIHFTTTSILDVPPTPTSETRSELYRILSQVGEGTFGKVYKAQNTITKIHVALKRIRMESEKDGFPVTAMREIKLLQSLQHTNIVRLYEMMVSNEASVYMVFEYMDHDLTGVLSQTQFNFTDAHLKSLCHQMLAGLAYLHHKGVIHRDIKGSNILINNKGELKLADFGLARFYQKRRRTDYTNRVITLWYRPPELLFGATVYGPEVDMWSAGCIMLELFTKKPVFQGNDEIHQLDVVYKIIGTPTAERWAGIMDLPWYELVKPKDTIPNRFRELFQKWMSPAALDLAERLLTYNPSMRVTALQAMDAPYFTQEDPKPALPVGQVYYLVFYSRILMQHPADLQH